LDAIDHETGKVLAYVIGKHQDSVLLRLKKLLEPFGIKHFFTDGWGGYEQHISPTQISIGKTNTQKIEKKHLTLRTRIKCLTRKTICFSKSEEMHDIIIGLFINNLSFA
jgi:insertion element IS1 protein InsB